MKIGVVSYTRDPERVISLAAGLCYGKDTYSEARIRSCYKAGHGSILEHASVTYLIDGISRACSHQLVRQRLASYNQRSQRYVKLDPRGGDWYVIPPSIESLGGNAMEWYKRAMEGQAEEYAALIASGVKPEDARFVLPEATKTSIVVTMNYRELFHFFDMRLGPRAQWEIRALAEGMLEGLKCVSEFMHDLYVENRGSTRVD